MQFSNIKSFYIIVSLLLWQTIDTASEDYCFRKCENGEYHTLCKFEGTSQYCKGFYHVKDIRGKSEILQFHNNVRNSFAGGNANKFHPPAANMMLMKPNNWVVKESPVHDEDVNLAMIGAPWPQSLAPYYPRKLYSQFIFWDGELEKSALRWAQQCTASLARDDCRDLYRFKVGQNVAILRGNVTVGYAPVRELLAQWYNQWASMDVPIVGAYNKEGADVDELTQMLWADTERVGCADVIYRTANGDIIRQLVCNYGPKGNNIGQPVYQIGKPCSACPLGTSCLLGSLENLCAGERIEQEPPPHQD